MQSVLRRIVVTIALASLSAFASAQPFPNGPINIVVPLAPGDAADITVRLLGEEMAKALNTPVSVTNRPGALMYGASTQICVPVSLARKGPALGAQAGEARLREVVVDGGGFSRFRRATETPFNLVLEARP